MKLPLFSIKKKASFWAIVYVTLCLDLTCGGQVYFLIGVLYGLMTGIGKKVSENLQCQDNFVFAATEKESEEFVESLFQKLKGQAHYHSFSVKIFNHS